MAKDLFGLDVKEGLLTGQQVAQELGVTTARVRQLCIEGRLPGCIKPARDWFIPRSGLQWFQANDRDRRVKPKAKDA